MALEPVAGQVYFSPECHAAYAELGFSPSPGATKTGVQLPDGPAYFTSRGSLLGQVPGEVVAAAFGVFNPEAVVPSVSSAGPRSTRRPSAPRARAARRPSWRAFSVPSPRGSGSATALLPTPWRRCGRRASRSSPGSWASACRATRSATCGAWPTCCASTAATRTPRRGPRPGSMPPRSACSPSSTGASPCAATSAPAAWSDDAARRGRGAARGAGPRQATVPSPTEGRAVREAIEVATDAQCAVIVDALGDGSTSLSACSRRGARRSATPGATRPRDRTTWRRSVATLSRNHPGLRRPVLRPLTRRDEQRRPGLVDARRVPDVGRVDHRFAGPQWTTCSTPSSSWTRSTRPERSTTTSSPAGWRSQPSQVASCARTQTSRPSFPSRGVARPVGRQVLGRPGEVGQRRRRGQPETEVRTKRRCGQVERVAHRRNRAAHRLSTAATSRRCAAAGSPSGRAPRARRAARCPGRRPPAGGRGPAST